MNHEIVSELKELREEVKGLRDTMIGLETGWNGGPGSWHICRAHVDEISELKIAEKHFDRNLAWMAGAFSVWVSLSTLFGPVIAAKIGLWHSPAPKTQGAP